MATAAERMAAMRARRRRGEVQVNVVVSERDFVKIAGDRYDLPGRCHRQLHQRRLAGSFSGGRERRDLRRLAHRGYTDAVSSDSALRANAVASFVSDTVTGDAGIA